MESRVKRIVILQKDKVPLLAIVLCTFALHSIILSHWIPQGLEHTHFPLISVSRATRIRNDHTIYLLPFNIFSEQRRHSSSSALFNHFVVTLP